MRLSELCHPVVIMEGKKPIAEMPLFIWKLTGALCHSKGVLGLLGGFIIGGYKWDYKSGRSWQASLIDGIKCWWGCRKAWKE